MTRRERWARGLEEPRATMALLALLCGVVFVAYVARLAWTGDPSSPSLTVFFGLPAIGYASVWPWLRTVRRRPSRIVWTTAVLVVGLALIGQAVFAASIPIADSCDICELYYPYWLCVLIGCW